MEKSMFSGMIINLKKRMACTRSDDANKSMFLMFGYYDSMDITYVDQWFKLRPKGVEDEGGNISISDDFIDKFTIKTYFPSSNILSKEHQEVFDYDLWRKIGTKNSPKELNDNKQEAKDCPFVCASMVNLSRESVRKGEHLTNTLCDIVSECVRNRQYSLKDLHCAVLPSIGYADFVILFLSNNIKSIMTILDDLKAAINKAGSEKKETPFISNCYSLIGFRNGMEKNITAEMVNDINLSVRFNLREGISTNDFNQRIKKYFDEDSYDIHYDDFNSYQLLGNSDCVILFNKNVHKVIKAFARGGFFNPGSEELAKFARYTRTSFRTLNTIKSIIDSEACMVHNSDKENENIIQESYKSQKADFSKLISRLRKIMADNNRPMRPVIGLQSVMKLYLNLVQFSHSFGIEYVVGQAFTSFAENVNATSELIKKAKKSSEKEYYLENLIYAIEIFRDSVGGYLADIQRSDRLFIEGQSLLHPSIGSATKLLFFYNRYINEMATALVSKDRNHEFLNEKFTFVVVSGGCDKTTAIEVFSMLPPLRKGRKPLIIIEIAEMSLYDIRGTMFRLLHECLHFCGERMRAERKSYVLKCMAESTAYSFTIMFYYFVDAWRTRIFESSIGKQYTHEQISKIKAISEEELVSCCELLLKDLRDNINGKFDTIKKILKNHELYGDYLYESLEVSIRELLNEKNFINMLCRQLLDYEVRYGENLQQKLEEAVNMISSRADVLKDIAIYKKQAMSAKEEKQQVIMDEMEACKSFIRAYCDKSYDEYMDFSREDNRENSCEDSQEDSQEENVAQLSLGDSIEIFALVFKECYADCIAASILDMSLSEFLLSFIYEAWDIEIAFSNDAGNAMRLAVDLEVLFGITNKLGRKHIKELKKKVELSKQQGFDYEKSEGYIEHLCNVIDERLDYYDSDPVFALQKRPIVEYIKKCQEFIKKEDLGGIVSIVESSKLENDKQLYDVLSKTRKWWKDMAR